LPVVQTRSDPVQRLHYGATVAPAAKETNPLAIDRNPGVTKLGFEATQIACGGIHESTGFIASFRMVSGVAPVE
jgi:hypothetical protein